MGSIWGFKASSAAVNSTQKACGLAPMPQHVQPSVVAKLSTGTHSNNQIPGNSKVLHLQRHGITEMNVYLRHVPYGSKGFKDPLFYDTRLTPDGAEGAKKSAARTKALPLQPELLVVSPLTRALDTARYAWPHHEGPVLVEALARERVWLSSDCGRPPSELKKDYPDGRYSFDHLPDIWWWTAGTQDQRHISLEPEDVFRARVNEFRSWLLSRPESSIGVVAHWGLLYELTGGVDFENCELRTFTLQPDGHLREASQVSHASHT